MMTLFDYPTPPARRGEETQAAGARKVAPVAGKLRENVRRVIARSAEHGVTIEEIAATLGMKTSTVCGRIGELRALGMVKDSGKRRTSSAGVGCKVWVCGGCNDGAQGNASRA